eukprot:366413-Chlamydomonas_euryale.AAC.11
MGGGACVGIGKATNVGVGEHECTLINSACEPKKLCACRLGGGHASAQAAGASRCEDAHVWEMARLMRWL